MAYGQMHLREVNKKKEGEECPQRSLGGESGLEGGKVTDTVVEKKKKAIEKIWQVSSYGKRLRVGFLLTNILLI